MCCCGKPTINGTDGDYRTHLFPPTVAEGEELLYDEPGRCGNGLDSHSYHFRVAAERGRVFLLVRHGAGESRIEFGWKKTVLDSLAALDSNGRYWLLCAAYHAQADAARKAREEVNYDWRKAAAEGRIKTRKVRGQSAVKVSIETPLLTA
jgi:hypothetical protein